MPRDTASLATLAGSAAGALSFQFRIFPTLGTIHPTVSGEWWLERLDVSNASSHNPK